MTYLLIKTIQLTLLFPLQPLTQTVVSLQLLHKLLQQPFLMMNLTGTTITSLIVKIRVQTTLTVMTMAFATTKNQLLNV